jgi:hypothetical protein
VPETTVTGKKQQVLHYAPHIFVETYGVDEVHAALGEETPHPSPPKIGCPTLRAVGEGWDKQKVRGEGLGCRAVVPHISQKTSEMWGTRALVVTEKRKRRSLGEASPRLYQPTYAGANVGHPDRVGVREEGMTEPPFHPDRRDLLFLSRLARCPDS